MIKIGSGGGSVGSAFATADRVAANKRGRASKKVIKRVDSSFKLPSSLGRPMSSESGVRRLDTMRKGEQLQRTGEQAAGLEQAYQHLHDSHSKMRMVQAKKSNKMMR